MTGSGPTARPLERFPVHLGLGGTAVAQPEFTGMEWYQAYADRNCADGAEGRLVGLHSFTEDWASWEMHPAGDELVVCTAGEMTLIQELPGGGLTRLMLTPGDFAINPPGVWHTADVPALATAIFVTCGMGTQNRPR